MREWDHRTEEEALPFPAYLETHSAPRRPADRIDHKCLLYGYSIFGPEFPFIDPTGNPVIARVSGKLVTSSALP